MSPDMKTLREALRMLATRASPHVEADEVHLSAALDELEALRGQAAYVASLDTENQRLRAEKAEAQRDELLAALEGLTKAFDARAVRGGVDWESNPAANVGAAFRAALAAIASARGGK